MSSGSWALSERAHLPQQRDQLGLEPRTCWSLGNELTTEPPCHPMWHNAANVYITGHTSTNTYILQKIIALTCLHKPIHHEAISTEHCCIIKTYMHVHKHCFAYHRSYKQSDVCEHVCKFLLYTTTFS